MAPMVAATSRTTTPASPSGASVKASSMPSLDRKPRVGGTAAIDAAPMTIDPKVHGMRRTSGPRRRMSRVPVWWSMVPASMNSEHLNSACAMVCTTAATMAKCVPTPMVATIQPSCETVEYATRRFRSVCWMAKIAADTAVAMPTTMSSTCQADTWAKAVEKRSSR